MAIVFALPQLFDDVKARFLSEGTSVENVFGWSKPTKHTAVNRICWVPGDPEGKLGQIGPPKQPGRIPYRPLMTVEEIIRFEIYGHDPTDPKNEMKQYIANCLIRDALLRALYLKAHGYIKIVDIERIKPERNEDSNGYSTRITAILDNMVPDSPVEIAPIDVGANVDVEELDVTEQIIVPAISAETNEGGDKIIITFPGETEHVGEFDFESEITASGATLISGELIDDTHFEITCAAFDSEAGITVSYSPTLLRYFKVLGDAYSTFTVAVTNNVPPP